MTGEMLSQEEINALLGGLDIDNEPPKTADDNAYLTPEQIDALGEIGNISMGTAATTLFALLNHKVMITTPHVEILSIDDFKSQITDDHIAVSVGYTEGLSGMNLLILNESDVKVIADLMMGGPGIVSDEPINELHLSAISEAMNQMIGSSSTSLSQMFQKKIDISPPEAIQMSSARQQLEHILGSSNPIAKISFRMQIEENIIDSQLMQVLPIEFAKSLVANLLGEQEQVSVQEPQIQVQPKMEPEQERIQMVTATQPQKVNVQQPVEEPVMPHFEMPSQMQNTGEKHTLRDVEVQKAEFPQFATGYTTYPKENMNVLLDVSLEVSVELGRTHKKIREILEFGPGSVIELDRLVGEPIDILVNGKFIAKGEVVVIDENFGVRITDIINPENRI
ncbi:MAG: flagellar motor switch phosphatase FliY [Cellulosilyticaceae bacterium]